MVNSNDLRPGMTIVIKNVLHQVLEYQHVKPGKGPAFVKTKVKNLTTRSIFEHSFRAKESVEQAIVDKKTMEFSYKDKNLYYFMDPETYEQVPVDQELLSNLLDYLKENEPVYFTMYKEDVIEVALPDFVNFTVTEALPGIKGDTATGGTKPVTLETGKVVQVPLFIKEGDILKIDTRTGKYMERAKG